MISSIFTLLSTITGFKRQIFFLHKTACLSHDLGKDRTVIIKKLKSVTNHSLIFIKILEIN